MHDFPEQLADNANKQQVKDFISKALNAHVGSSQELLFPLYFPLGEAWVRLKSMDKAAITAATATSANGTELKGAKAYCQNEFGKSHETIRLCVLALPYKDRAKAALNWFNDPGRNEWRDWVPSRQFAPQFIVELVETYQNKDQPPPPKKQPPPKKAEPLVSVPSDAEALTMALGQVEALKAQADTLDQEMKTELETARQEIARRDKRIAQLERILRDQNIDFPVEPLPTAISEWLKSIGDAAATSPKPKGRNKKAVKEVPTTVVGSNATGDATPKQSNTPKNSRTKRQRREEAIAVGAEGVVADAAPEDTAQQVKPAGDAPNAWVPHEVVAAWTAWPGREGSRWAIYMENEDDPAWVSYDKTEVGHIHPERGLDIELHYKDYRCTGSVAEIFKYLSEIEAKLVSEAA